MMEIIISSFTFLHWFCSTIIFCLIEDEFLGDATIYIEDVRKTPSSRQIIPLQSPSGGMEYQAGSLTVEVTIATSLF